MIFLQGFIKFDQCISETSDGQKCAESGIIRIITRNGMIWRIINGSQFQKRWWISIRKKKIYLETKFCPNRRIFVFWQTFWIQNGRHSTPKWMPYGAVCLTTCKYPFPLKCLFIFSFLTIYFDFILAAILKF